MVASLKRAPFVKNILKALRFRGLHCTKSDKYELIYLPVEQGDDSSQEHSGVGMSPTLDAKRTSGCTPREGSLNSSNGCYIIL